MNRESIYAAVFARLALLAPGTLVKTGRHLPLIDQEPLTAMPAVYQLQMLEKPNDYGMGNGIIDWTFTVDWYLYTGISSKTAPTTPVSNPLVDALLELLDADAKGQLIINGVAYGLSLAGAIQIHEGLHDGKAVTIIPINIHVPHN